MIGDAVNPDNTDNSRVNPPGMETPPELESSLGPLIHALKAENIRLLKPLSGGKTSARVFQAEIRFPSHSRTAILKFHRADALRSEIDRFSNLKEIIRNRGLFSQIFEPTDTRDNLPPGETTGVIAYSHVSDQLHGPCTSLSEVIDDFLGGRSEWQKLQSLLDTAFSSLEQLYNTGNIKTVDAKTISAYYQDRWVPHYRAKANCFEPGGENRWPLLTLDKFNPPSFSKTLSEKNANPTNLMKKSEESEPGNHEVIISGLTCKGRWGKTLYLAAKPYLLSIAVDCSALREDDIKAIEKIDKPKLGLWMDAGEARYDFYKRCLESAFPGIDLNAPGFKIGTVYFHNPLRHISEPFHEQYLRGQVPVTPAHGDLHPGNILVVRDNPVFIDYGLAEKEMPFGIDYARFLGSIIRGRVAPAVPYESLLVLLRHTFEESAPNTPLEEPAQRALQLLQYVFGKTKETFTGKNPGLNYLWLHLYGFSWIGLKWKEAADNEDSRNAYRACFLLACLSYAKLFPQPLPDETFPLLTPSAGKSAVEYLQGLPSRHPAHKVLDQWVSGLEKKNAGAADKAGLHGKEFRTALVTWLDRLVEKGLKIAAADAPLLLAVIHLNSLDLWLKDTRGALFEKTAPPYRPGLPAPPRQKLLLMGTPGFSTREFLESSSEANAKLSEAGLKSGDILALGNILAVFPGLNQGIGDERVLAVGGLAAMLNALTFGKERLPRSPQDWPKSQLNPEEFWRWIRVHAAEAPRLGDSLFIDNKYGTLEVTFTPVVCANNDREGRLLADELTAWARYLLSGTDLSRILERSWKLGFVIKPPQVKFYKNFSRGGHDVGRLIRIHFDYLDRQRGRRGTGGKEQYLAPGMHTVTPGEPGQEDTYRSLIRLGVEQVYEESEDNGQAFLSGGVPKWSDIHGGYAVPRERLKEFTAMFRRLEGTGDTVILWIYSACGNGKTTAAMRLAYDLLPDQKLLQGVQRDGFLEKSPSGRRRQEIYWRPKEAVTEAPLDIELLKKIAQPAVVIVDDAQMVPNLVYDVKQYLAWREKKPGLPSLHFVFVYQGMQWNQNKPNRDIGGRVKHHFWNLDPLSEGEAEGIARQLARSGLVEGSRGPGEIAARLRQRGRDITDLLTAMLLVVKGRTDFAEIIHDLLRGISDPLLLEAYTTVAAVCRLHERNYITPRLLAYPYGMTGGEYTKRVLNPLNAELRPLAGEKHPNQLRSRHPRIADIAFRFLVRSTDAKEKDIYVDLVKSAVEASRFVGWKGELKLCTRLLMNLPCRGLRRACYRDLLEKESLDSYLIQTWALMESKEGHLDLARILYYKAIAEDEQNVAATQAWACLEVEEGNGEMARELFARGTNADPKNVQSWQAWALMEAELGKYDEARRLFKEGTKADRTNAPLWQAWALMEAELGKYDEARRLFKEGTKANAKDPVTWQAWALMEAELGKYDEARRLFKEGINADPKNAPLWQAWALMEAELGKYDEARRLFKEGINADRTHVQSWHAWALMEEKCGNLEPAREYMERSAPFLRTEKSRGIYRDFKTREARRSAGETVEIPFHSEGKRKFLPSLPQPWHRKDKDKNRTGKAFPSGIEKEESEAQARRELEYFSRLSPRELVDEILARLDAAIPNPVPGISCPPDTVCYLGKCPYRGS